jgi:hypothetical protein
MSLSASSATTTSEAWEGLVVGTHEERIVSNLFRIADIDRDGRIGRRDAQVWRKKKKKRKRETNAPDTC